MRTTYDVHRGLVTVAMQLGGNIVLEGFDGKDFTEMIVVKKMVGQYVRRLSDDVGAITKLTVTLSESEGKDHVEVKVVLESGVEAVAAESAHNLYMALDVSLRKATEQVH